MTTATRSFRRGPSGRLLGTRIDDPGFIELGALSSGHRVLGFDIDKGRKAVRVIEYAAATHGFEGSLFTRVDVVQEVPYGEGVDVAALSPQHPLSPGLAHPKLDRRKAHLFGGGQQPTFLHNAVAP